MLNEFQKKFIDDATVKIISDSMPDYKSLINALLSSGENIENVLDALAKAVATSTASMTVQYILEILDQSGVISIPDDEHELQRLTIHLHSS